MLYGFFGQRGTDNIVFGMTYLFWFFMLAIVAVAFGLIVTWIEK
jgi:hypothetical protein